MVLMALKALAARVSSEANEHVPVEFASELIAEIFAARRASQIWHSHPP
jgi:hypothetical protein